MLKLSKNSINNIINSLDSNVRENIPERILKKMIVFLTNEIRRNKKIKNEKNCEARASLLLKSFSKKFKTIIRKKNIILPIFVDYFLDKIVKELEGGGV